MALNRPNTSAKTTQAVEEEQKAENASRAVEAAEQTPEATPTPEQVETQEPEREQVDADDVDVGNAAPTEPEKQSNIAEASSQPTELAEVKASVPAPSASSVSMQSIAENLAAQGFEDTQLSAMGFERVAIANGEFVLGQQKDNIGKELKGTPQMSKNVNLVTRSDDDADDELFYTYSKDPLNLEGKGVLNTEGKPMTSTLAEWAADGFEPGFRTYKEVLIEVTECEGHEELIGELLMLSIAPASVKKYDAQLVAAVKRYKVGALDLTGTFKVGKAIKGGNNKMYNPWAIRFAPAEAE